MFEYLEEIGLSFKNISEEGGHTVKIAEKEITDGRLIDLFHLAKQKGVEIHTDLPKWISKICYINIFSLPVQTQSASISTCMLYEQNEQTHFKGVMKKLK